MRQLLNIDVGGVRLAYAAHGDPAAPPMVLLHGASDTGESWNPVVAPLAATHRVYVLDQRGHGASDWPGRYSFELLRDDVVGFLGALSLDRVVLIGHSMGGTVAWLVAEEHPHRLTHLVVEDTAPPRPGRERLPKRVRPDRPLPFDWNAREAVVAQVNDPDPAWWQRAAQIATPTLIIAGGPDSHESQEQLAELAGRLETGRLVTIPVGHDVHAEAPEAFVGAVREFLGSSPG
jgi:pimeloyl-ACP methyl ester carboxylesterase